MRGVVVSALNDELELSFIVDDDVVISVESVVIMIVVGYVVVGGIEVGLFD